MQIAELFERAVGTLRGKGVPFAVVGGFAADVYRSEHRVTEDVDLCVLVAKDPVEFASDVVESLGLGVAVIRRADLDGGPMFAIRRKSSEPCIVAGRPKGRARGPGVDILLPSMPWVPDAISRAQDNQVDFGFGPVPTIAIEDVIIAKLSCLKRSAARPKDMDDLVSIFETKPELDLKYLGGQMKRFGLVVPKTLMKSVSQVIAKVSRDVAKDLRLK